MKRGAWWRVACREPDTPEPETALAARARIHSQLALARSSARAPLSSAQLSVAFSSTSVIP